MTQGGSCCGGPARGQRHGDRLHPGRRSGQDRLKHLYLGQGQMAHSPVALVLGLLVQVGLGFTDIVPLSDAVLVGIHLRGARRADVGVESRHALRALARGPRRDCRGPRVCANCSHLVPAIAFCHNVASLSGHSAPPSSSATWP